MGDDQPQVAVATAEEELLTLSETIEFLGISKQTLYRMMERGEVKGVRVGRQWRFRKADLATYLERGPVGMTMAAAPVDLLDGELDFFAQRLGAPVNGNGEDLPPGERKIGQLINAIILLAIGSRSSDIHLEPARLDEEQVLLLRYRVDGVMHEVRRLPISIHAGLIARLKTMCDLNVEERRIPQDGRIHLRHEGREYDIRFNTNPTIFGEGIVMRILDQHSVLLGLEKLGLLPDDLARLRTWLKRPTGVIYCVGSTGSGKTTTIYSCLLEIAKPETKTLSIEDPVEIMLPWVTQSAVIRKSGYTFPVALRGFMRQDPDVVFVGEIRDLETAEIITQAALTGHLVFTTLHPVDAPSTPQRLMDMGIAPFLIGASTEGIISQRLVRKLCPHCKQPAEVTPHVMKYVRQLARAGGYTLPEDAVFSRAVGCEQCFGRGYLGRTALFELLEFTPEVKDAFLRGATPKELMAAMVMDGMTTLIADGIQKAALGITSIEEVLRVAQGMAGG